MSGLNWFRLRMIVAPLAVMLMLTLLVGFSALQVIRQWDTTTQHLMNAPLMAGHLSEQAAHAQHMQRMQTTLRDLKNHSSRVTLTMTISLGLLGILLLVITAMDLSRLMRQLQRSRDLTHRVQEAERRRLSGELHDGVIQNLIALQRHYSPEKTDAIIQDVRRICHNLKPKILEDLGMRAALEFLAEDLTEHDCRVTFNIEAPDIEQLPEPYALPLFRIIQELFSNIRQHAEASQVTLTWVYKPDESPMLRLYVRDNGCGFTPNEQPPRSPAGDQRKQERGRGLGLSGISERASQLGGTVQIDSTPGHGSFVQVLVPVQPERRREGATRP